MLAIQCSDLPGNLKHLVHVMALRADNDTGVGLTGQVKLGRYLSVGDRQVRKLQDQLEEAWQRGASPVRITYEKRKHNSDRYTLTLRDDAPLELRDTVSVGVSTGTVVPDELRSSTGPTVPAEPGSTGTVVPAGPVPEIQKAAVNRNPRPDNLRSPSTEGPTEKNEPSTQNGADGANAPRAETQPETTELGPCGVCLVQAHSPCRPDMSPHAREACGLDALKVSQRGMWARRLARSAQTSDHAKLLKEVGPELGRLLVKEAAAKAKAKAAA